MLPSSIQFCSNARFFSLMEQDGERVVRVVDTPFDAPPVAAQTAGDAFEAVLARVGAWRPIRDRVDARLIAEVRQQTGKLINSQKDVGGWPDYRPAAAPADSDADGMPDAWEASHGVRLLDPADAAKDRDADGRETPEATPVILRSRASRPIKTSAP